MRVRKQIHKTSFKLLIGHSFINTMAQTQTFEIGLPCASLETAAQNLNETILCQRWSSACIHYCYSKCNILCRKKSSLPYFSLMNAMALQTLTSLAPRKPRCFPANRKVLALVYLPMDKTARVHTQFPLYPLPLCPTDSTLGVAG